MASFDDDLPVAGNFDMDRVIIDPDYRRAVIVRLRQDRLRREAALRPPATTDLLAVRRDD